MSLMRNGRPAMKNHRFLRFSMILRSKPAGFGNHFGAIGTEFGSAGVAWTPILRVWGAPGRILRAVGAKDALPGSPALHFDRFLVQHGSQNSAKMEPRS